MGGEFQPSPVSDKSVGFYGMGFPTKKSSYPFFIYDCLVYTNYNYQYIPNINGILLLMIVWYILIHYSPSLFIFLVNKQKNDVHLISLW